MANRLPDVSIGFQDGNLGRAAASAIGGTLYVGTSTIVTPEPIRIRSKKDIPTLLGEGMLAEEIDDHLTVANPPAIWAMSIEPDVFLSPQVKIEGSTEEAKLPTLSGTSQTAWEATFIITTAGAPNTATFKWYLNGVEQEELTVPTSKRFVIDNTGVTITFKDDYALADSFTVYTEGTPSVSDAKMIDTLESVLKYRLDVEFLTVVNPMSKIALAGFTTLLENMADYPNNYYTFALTRREGMKGFDGSLEEYVAMLQEDVKSYRSKRLMVLPFEVPCVSRGVEKLKIPVGLVAAKISTTAVGPAINEVVQGGIVNILDIYPANLEESIRAELTDSGYAIFTTLFGADGVYIAIPRTTMEDTSDYRRIEVTRMTNKQARDARKALLPFINSSVKVSKDGKMTNISMLEAQLRIPLKRNQESGEFSEFRAEIDENQNILATGALKLLIRVIPLGLIEFIEIEVGLENPATA